MTEIVQWVGRTRYDLDAKQITKPIENNNNLLHKPVMRSHTKRAETGHNSWFRGFAQRERVTPIKKASDNVA